MSFRDDDGLGLRGIDDAGSLGSGAWRGKEGEDSVWDPGSVWRIPPVPPWVAQTQEVVPEIVDLELNSLQGLMIYIQWDKLLNSLGLWFSYEKQGLPAGAFIIRNGTAVE